MHLAETTRDNRTGWVAALRTVRSVDPLYVVAGHKHPERGDDPSNIDESVRYLTDFNEAELGSSTALELNEAMLSLHPLRANPGALWGAAKLVKGAP